MPLKGVEPRIYPSLKRWISPFCVYKQFFIRLIKIEFWEDEAGASFYKVYKK